MNQVPNGYKLTEVGVIPEDWEISQLGRDIRLKSGCHILAQFCNDGADGVSYITGPSDFINGNIVATKSTIKPLVLCSCDDILITVKGSGAGSLAKSNGVYCISRQLMAITTLNWSSDYLYSVLQFRQADLLQLSTGLIPGLSRTDILTLNIPLPPLHEQKAIAQALSDADAYIESLEKLIAKKKLVKQGAMQELLTGKKRLAGFGGGKGYKQTELGLIPEDWEVLQLSEVLSENPKYGINAAAVPLTPNALRYIRITDISDDGYYVPNEEIGVDHSEALNYLLVRGDILLARTGASVGKSYLHRDNDFKLVYAGFLIKITIDKNLASSDYVFHFMRSDLYWMWVKVMSMRSGQPGINGKEYSHMKLPMPTLSEQEKIAEILSNVDEEVLLLKQKLNKARQLKQGMMQDLLTGKVRLV